MSRSDRGSRSLPRRGRARSLSAFVVGVLLSVVAALSVSATAALAAQSTTYQATIVIPVPPASSFQGSGGGDGWGLAMTPTAVYNVFHHQDTSLQVACHLQSDASACWPTKTITDGSGNGFASQGDPGLFLDQATGHLFVFATRLSDLTGGVVCIDTTQPAANLDPFCGFTQLTGVGEAASGISEVSAPAMVGTKWYAFNYVDGAAPLSGANHTQNAMLCFDTTTDATCAGQPFTVDATGTTMNNPTFPSPPATAIGGKVVVPLTVDSVAELACFDPAADAACTGSWPITGVTGSSVGAAFPLLSATGTTLGFCLPTGVDPCFGLDGASVSTPANLTTVVTGGSPWNGPAVTIGARVYVAQGGIDNVACFDYSSNQSCANFPKTFSNLGYLYTVNPDPQRPSCLWVNADSGSGQIQNFDAFTGGQCGQGPTRVLASSFVVPTQVCAPTSWNSIQVTDPQPSAYTSGTVDFRDVSGNAIPGVSQQSLDNTGSSDLRGLDLTGSLPQFLITLNGLPAVPTSVTVKLTWTATFDPSCTTPLVSATNQPPTGSAGGPYTGTTGSPTTLSGTASDPEHDPLTYLWSVAPQPGSPTGAACTIANPATLVTSVTCNDAGSYSVSLSLSDGHNPPTIETTTLSVTNPRSRHGVSGGGTIDDRGRLRFWFSAQPRPFGLIGGQLSATTGRHRFHASTITSLDVTAPSATLSGTGSWDGKRGYTFTATAFDHGRGGGEHSAHHDRFSLTVTSPRGTVVLNAGGALTQGNITIH